MGALGLTEFLLILFVVIFGLLLPILALVDIVKSKFEANTKLIWVIIVVFVNVLGVILYFTIGRSQKIDDYRER